MKISLRVAFLILFSCLWACGPKGAKLQKSVVPPDKNLFETGTEYLKKNQFIKARLALQTLINTYPDSELTADSYLTIGDSFYSEGGTENFLQAEDQYKNFIVFFPTNPKAVDAQMKIVSLNMKMMRAPDRDASYSYKAEAAINKLLEQWPDSDYAPIAKELLKEVQENLARSNFDVGQFYAEKGNYAGAKSRFQEIADRYQDFSELDRTYFRLAEVLQQSNNPDEAAIYYGRIAQGFPQSKLFEEAKARLTNMGKSVPAVDPQLAARHQPRETPADGFSPLKPLVELAGAIGFVGQPDRYEEAKRLIEAKKADAAAQNAKAAEVGKAGDDILIQTTLRKDASGKTQETTVLGGESPAAAPSANKSNSKKSSGKDTKKKDEKKPT
jgi:outer membrane assembly lipoprotein YfiO